MVSEHSSPSRSTFYWLLLGLATVTVALLLVGGYIYRIREQESQRWQRVVAGTATVDMVRQYVAQHQGKWPQSWDDLDAIDQFATPGRQPLSLSLRKAVAIDFTANPAELVQQNAATFSAIRPIGTVPSHYREYWFLDRLLEELRKHHPLPPASAPIDPSH